MSEEDKSQKTEEPTQKKLEDAQKKGDVARSQEIRHLAMLAGGGLAIAIFAGQIGVQVSNNLSVYLAKAGQIPADAPNLALVGRDVVTGLLGWLGLPLLLLVVAALTGSVLQAKPILTTEKIKPKFSKISLTKGFGRLFSSQSVMEFTKGLLKLAIVATVVILVVWPDRDRLDTLMTYAPADMLDYVKVAALKMFGGAIAIMGLIAAADFLYQRSEFLKKQRMSRQEIKDEHKQTDGDPQVKARIQRIRMERARGRMMAAVPQATLVIANPTHFAVALKYEHQEMNAPVCVAKGVDEVALRIRSVAEENGVPVVENPPLARALHAAVELEQEITPEHYQAVAEVIGYVMGLRK